MAKIRIGFSTHFEVENELVGIGTDNPTNTKQVLGNIHASNVKAIGISTLTTYQGFLDKEAKISNNIDINSQAGTLGEVVIDGDVTVSSGSTLCSGVDELSLTDSFSVPTGNTDSRIHCHTAGSMRFNEDFGTLEFYTGDEWRTVNSFKDTGNRGRGVFAGGRAANPDSSNHSEIDFFNIASQGNAQRFGDLATARMWAGGASSAIRGLFSSGTPTTNMDYITIASEGNGITFGTCDQTGGAGSLASSTRALFGGGYSNTTNAIQYVEIMTLGNSVDFGDLRSRSNFEYIATASNPVRGFFMANGDAGNNQNSDVDVVTIAAKGNSIKFGDLTHKRGQSASFSNSTRAIQACGSDGPSARSTNTIDYITMSSDGTGIDFGDSPDSLSQLKTGAASQTRGCFAGGTTNGSDAFNTINFIQIATTGNAQDFGDLFAGRRNGMGGLSDSHGGLGGF